MSNYFLVEIKTMKCEGCNKEIIKCDDCGIVFKIGDTVKCENNKHFCKFCGD